MIEAVDTSVGRVVAKLDELGLAEKTLIVFISDNGGVTGKALLEPLRSQKGSLFEAGVRVPCAMRWKGTIKAGDSIIKTLSWYENLGHAARLLDVVRLYAELDRAEEAA